MNQKTISFSMAGAILIAYLWSQLQPNDALFLLVSPNAAINMGLLGLSILMVRLSFINRFKTKLAYMLTVVGAIFGLAIGGIGMLVTTYNFSFLSWLGPLDFMLVGELGIILSICALTYEHQPLRLRALTSAGMGEATTTAY